MNKEKLEKTFYIMKEFSIIVLKGGLNWLSYNDLNN